MKFLSLALSPYPTKPMTYNFSELTTESQREIFERLCAFDVAAEWVAKFSGLDIALVRTTLLGAGALEASSRDEDEIALFWADMDKSGSTLP